MITRFLESDMINVNDTLLDTPLIHIAIMNRNAHAVEELLRLGANPTDRKSGQTCLKYAIERFGDNHPILNILKDSENPSPSSIINLLKRYLSCNHRRGRQ